MGDTKRAPMRTAANLPTDHAVPNAGSLPRPWLWQVWVGIAIAFAAALTGYYAIRRPLSVTPPTLSCLGDTCTVAFTSDNNTDEARSVTFRVGIGLGTVTRKSGAGRYAEFAHQTVAVTLAPHESRKISCDFVSASQHRPNVAQVEITANQRLSP